MPTRGKQSKPAPAISARATRAHNRGNAFVQQEERASPKRGKTKSGTRAGAKEEPKQKQITEMLNKSTTKQRLLSATTASSTNVGLKLAAVN